MNAKELEKLLDCCFIAKKIIETLPALPKGIKPRHIHVLHVIYKMAVYQEECCVSDISRTLNITLPSVTKLVKELEERKLIRKHSKSQDKRTILLKLTDKGEAYVKKYVLEFPGKWADNLADISTDQVEQTVQTITRLQETMPGLEN